MGTPKPNTLQLNTDTSLTATVYVLVVTLDSLNDNREIYPLPEIPAYSEGTRVVDIESNFSQRPSITVHDLSRK